LPVYGVHEIGYILYSLLAAVDQAIHKIIAYDKNSLENCLVL